MNDKVEIPRTDPQFESQKKFRVIFHSPSDTMNIIIMTIIITKFRLNIHMRNLHHQQQQTAETSACLLKDRQATGGSGAQRFPRVKRCLSSKKKLHIPSNPIGWLLLNVTEIQGFTSGCG